MHGWWRSNLKERAWTSVAEKNGDDAVSDWRRGGVSWAPPSCLDRQGTAAREPIQVARRSARETDSNLRAERKSV